MNEQLEQSLADLINKAIQGADAAKDFLVAETPEVIQQLLVWHGIYNFIGFCAGMSLLLLSVVGGVKFWRWVRSEYENKDPFNVAFPGALIHTGITLFGVVCLNVEWLKIWIAPKVWLLEYAAKMLSS